MKIAYLDCFAGVSGDMIIGALLDAGLDFDFLNGELQKLELQGYSLSSANILKNGISCIKFDVTISEQHSHRNLSDITDIIQKSRLDDAIKKRSIDIFTSLGKVEAKIHGKDISEIHFHELGAVDTIVDIVGAVIGFEALGIQGIFCSAVNVGQGYVKTAHGMLPVPAPATAALLSGVPVFSSGIDGELATPTGAALVRYLAESFGPIPAMTYHSIGCGAGSKNLPIPNILRIFIGEANGRSYRNDDAIMIETNIDDMSPEYYEYCMDRLFAEGALDVFMIPAVMKKSRPGTLLCVLATREKLDDLCRIIFAETTTAGVRISHHTRYILDRRFETAKTKYGQIQVKLLIDNDNIVTIAPEYEDCRKAALASNVPLYHVYDEALAIVRKLHDYNIKIEKLNSALKKISE